jgi:hypothetical protein
MSVKSALQLPALVSSQLIILERFQILINPIEVALEQGLLNQL